VYGPERNVTPPGVEHAVKAVVGNKAVEVAISPSPNPLVTVPILVTSNSPLTIVILLVVYVAVVESLLFHMKVVG
jgi:hypothetical protein